MIRFEQVGKVYPDGTTAVDGLSFEVREGELVTLVGPSGCGKTTTMMMVNRLIDPTSGRILVDGEDIAHVDPVRLRRGMGYVIQQAGLFPHRTVLDNAAAVPLLLGWSRARARARAAELLELVGLDPATYGSRYPGQLSGGQRQRVGVARALAADPPVLLMDEPFGAVDPVVRERLQGEFLALQADVRKTVLLVTHDIEEAVRMGDRIAVYGRGRIAQYDTPAAVLGAPASGYVAEFVGADRGLKRLSVTAVEASDLEQPPVAHTGERSRDVARRMRATGARWAVVLDEEGGLHGWVSAKQLSGTDGRDAADGGDGADRADGGDRVGDLAGRMEAWVPLGAPLKRAFGEMLQHDAGWVAVLDGERFAGVLTPAGLHEALRRSVDADAHGIARGDVDFSSVSDA